MNNREFSKLLRRNLVLPLALTTVVALAFILVVINTLIFYQDLMAGDRIVAQTNQVLRLIVDAETGLRGYLLTADDLFLQPSREARRKLGGEFKELRALVENDVALTAKATKIEDSFGDWLRAAFNSDGTASTSAKDVTSMKARKDLMDTVRGVVTEFLINVETKHHEREAKARYFVGMMVLIIALVTMALGLFIALLGRRSLLALSDSYTNAIRKQSEQETRLRERAWIDSGFAEIATRGLGESTVRESGDKILSFLVEYVGGCIGALYLLKDNQITLAGTVATQPGFQPPKSFEQGESLLGQVIRDGKICHVPSVQRSSLRLSSGLVEGAPDQVILVPIKAEKNTIGVVEIGFVGAFTAGATTFLDSVAETLGSTLNAVIYRTELRRLLDRTREQAESLSSANRELSNKTEELTVQQAELEQINEELAQQQTELEAQKESLEQTNYALREARNDLQKNADSLRETGRYKSEFLANMSHELRTPLNSILILAQLLMEADDEKTKEEVEMASTIYASATDLLALINDVLDLSKVEAGKLDIHVETVAPSEITSRLERIFRPQTNEKNLTFDVKIEDGVPDRLRTDRARVEQILRNFLSNAVKFTESGGIEVVVSELDGGVCFSVKDSGIGVPEDKQKVIFDAFQQADGTIGRKFGGTGLGLTISRELSRLLDAKISLKSELGKGTQVTLCLPLSIEQPAETPAKATAIKPREVSKIDDRQNLKVGERKVLVIEDDERFASLLIDCCRKRGFKCLHANDGAVGIEEAKKFQPHAILLDLNLPGKNGLEVLDSLKLDPNTRHIPIHIISVDDREFEMLQKGAVGFLHKPVSTSDLDRIFDKFDAVLSNGPRTVLIVEDNDVDRKAIAQLLQRADVKSEGAATGLQATEWLRKRKFDCVVLDLKLPDTSGIDLLKRWREDADMECPPVIVYTGKDLSREEKEDLDGLSRSIIIKGVKSPERLLDEVTLFLHRVEKQLPKDLQEMLTRARHREEVFEGKKILLVDDDIRNIYALRAALLKKGCVVSVAKNGREAIEKLNETPDLNLVLMDIMMPEMDGYEAIARIRTEARFKALPIIALTAKAMRGDREKCLEVGANDYLSKPIDVERLMSLMRVWLSR